MKGNKTYLFVHGAWHAGWCWQPVLAFLQPQGHQTITLDLPGHGNDSTSFSHITLKTYVDAVIEKVKKCEQPVTLVGHSMAGIIISEVAEYIASAIDRLIYIAAFIPLNQQSLFQQAQQLKTRGISAHMQVNPAKYAIYLKNSQRLKKIFFNRCDAHVADQALSRLQPEPLQPFVIPVTLTEKNWGKVKKRYIGCLHDHVFPFSDQQKIAEAAGCEFISIPADHSPFLSTPEKLGECLRFS